MALSLLQMSRRLKAARRAISVCHHPPLSQSPSSDKDDILVGKLESYGMTDAYDQTADQDIRLWVEDYALTKTTALEKLLEKCEN